MEQMDVYWVTIVCPGVTEELGSKAAADVAAHFAADRKHYQNVSLILIW